MTEAEKLNARILETYAKSAELHGRTMALFEELAQIQDEQVKLGDLRDSLWAEQKKLLQLEAA